MAFFMRPSESEPALAEPSSLAMAKHARELCPVTLASPIRPIHDVHSDYSKYNSRVGDFDVRDSGMRGTLVTRPRPRLGSVEQTGTFEGLASLLQDGP